MDPPARTNPEAGGNDRAADIADVFVWHRDDGGVQKVVLALTYAGPNLPVADQSATFDADVLYVLHIDSDVDETGGDAEPEQDILVRFGQSASGNWGVQLEGVPGADGAQAGPVETVNRIVGVTDGFYFAGLRDDPFFFDLQGFRDTTSTGNLSFDAERDFFEGQNSSVIVIELVADDIDTGANETFSVWAETRRLPGA